MTLNFTRVELDFDYPLWSKVRESGRDTWNVWFRLPFEVKDQKARIASVDPATPPDVLRDMQDFNDLHHRTEAFSGLADISLLFAYSEASVFKDGDRLTLAIGTTIPVGETVENPLAAGEAGIQHQHIQFGSGTFDPLAEIYYTLPQRGKLSFSGYLLGRFPSYENSKGFRGSTEVTLDLEGQYQLTEPLAAHVGFVGLYQDFSKWDGQKDLNSGMFSLNVLAGYNFRRPGGPTLRLDLMWPLHQETLSDSGDTFKQGPMVIFSASSSF